MKDIKINPETGQIEEVFKAKTWKTEIIGKFLKKEKLEDKVDKLNWAGQIKILNKLKKVYKEEEFWYYLADNLGFKLNNMAYFLMPAGKQKLLDSYNKWKFADSNKLVILEDLEDLEKVELNKEKTPKKLTLMDFLNK